MNSRLNEIITNYIKKYDLNSLDVTANPRELIVMLLADSKNCSTIDVKLGMAKITDEDILKLEAMLDKIAIEKIPPQYVTGVEYIYGSKFYVTKDVLVPRQDTETLIEQCINIVKKENYKSMLDLCTGSGIVGICVSKNTNLEQVTLSDISEKALDVAKKNIHANDVSNVCNIVCSNMFENLYKLKNKYDIIVSNPPYLTKSEMEEISEFVAKEPKSALYGGEDGLEFYNIIFDEARYFLNDGGLIAVEIGHMQAQDVKNIISKYKEYSNIQIIKDINGKDRVVLCHFQKK